MNVQRAYSVFTVKSAEQADGKRTLKGIATTPSPDRVGDVVEPKGAKFALPLPLLWQHDASQPIGHVTEAKVTKNGISVVAELVLIDEPGTLKDRLDEAWQSLKSGLVRGFSIGFRGLKDGVEYDSAANGFVFKAWEWLELSAVTIPANMDATIQTVKALDLGVSAEVVKSLATPSGEGKPVKLSQPKEKGQAMNFAERLRKLREEKNVKAKRLLELGEAADDAGETMGKDAAEEFKGLEADLVALDDEIARVEKLQTIAASTAKAVTGDGSDEGSNSRAGSRAVSTVTLKTVEKLAPGQAFARLAMLQIKSRGDTGKASRLAQQYYPQDEALNEMLKAVDSGFDLAAHLQAKASVPAGTTTGTTWAAPLVTYENYTGDFVNYLRPRSILGQLDGTRRIPFMVRIAAQTSKATGYWVGEGKAKPVTKFDVNAVQFGWFKTASIAVLTNELIRFSDPSAELLVRDELAAAILETQDEAFIDPANAGSANVKPKSITNGITAIHSSGNTADDIRADVAAAYGVASDANNPFTAPRWIMDIRTATALSMMQNPLGQQQYPGLTPQGGTFMGAPVIVSNYVPRDTSGSLLVLVNASDIWYADDGGVTIDASQEASIEMSDAPTGASGTPTGASLVSMWQTNSTAYRAERYINWARRRESGVVVIDQVNYTA